MTRTALGADDAGDDPLEGLRSLQERRRELFALERRLVMRARVGGASWKQVGAAIGVSGQAAHKRYRRDVT